ncbi:MAG: EipB family protein [Geminicoccaceae bacterium]
MAFRRARWFAALVAAAACSTSVAAAAQSVLNPHRAFYRLKLEQEANDLNGLVAVNGGLAIEWQGMCDGWTSSQRISFVAEMEDGYGYSYDVVYNTWESFDATKLRYSMRSFEDGQLASEYSGTAQIGTDGKGTALFSLPESRVIDLPVGTLFPVAHLRRILASMSSKPVLLTHSVFDGSGFDSLTDITTVVSAPAPTEAPGQQWPVSMAYHKSDDSDLLPEFEVSFQLDPDGVMRDMVLDYGDFRLGGTLDEVEELPEPDC